MSGFKPTKTSSSRVFLIDGRARPDHQPAYHYSYRMNGITQGYGDIETIENPDPSQYGKFVEIGQTRGATERVTTTLEGRYAMELQSELLKLVRQGCTFDVQLHFGECTDPSSFNTFKKALILEKAYLTNFATDDLGAIQSDDDAAINERADLSAVSVYEVLPINYAQKGGTVVTGEVIDATLCDTLSCGDCTEESDGCNKIFAITAAAGGSPSTPADVVYSLDGGTTWYAHDVDTISAAEAGSGIACVGDYVVVVSNASNSAHYALKSEFLAGTGDPSFTEVTTGFVAGGEPNAISSLGSTAYVVGDFGYVYLMEDATSGVSVLDAGVSTVAVLNDVHAFSSELIVAVGNGGAIVYSTNGTTFGLLTTSPVGVGVNLNTVLVKTEKEWLIGTSTGRIYYTVDAGVTWTEKGFSQSGTGAILDIAMSSNSVLWAAHQTSLTKGRILRSYDGGYSWVVTPESGSIPASDKINALVACGNDANFVVGVGLADDATDGFILVGNAS